MMFSGHKIFLCSHLYPVALRSRQYTINSLLNPSHSADEESRAQESGLIMYETHVNYSLTFSTLIYLDSQRRNHLHQALLCNPCQGIGKNTPRA